MKRRFTFWIDGQLPARNDSEGAARACWQAGSALKRKHTRLVEIAARRVKDVAWVPMRQFTVRVEYRCPNRRKDPDNIIGGLKYILDGLQEANVITNDGWRNVIEIGQMWVLDAEHPGVLVELEEWATA